MIRRSPTRPVVLERGPAAVTALLAAVVLLVAAGCHSGQDTGGITPAPAPPDPTTSASASPTPSPTPHPSPSATSTKPDPDAATAKAVVAAYKHYIAVLISEGKKEPTGRPSKQLLALTTGLESNYVRNNAAEDYKEQSHITKGHVVVTAGTVTLSSHAAKAVFEVCLDYRTVRYMEHGKSAKSAPWARNRVQMKRVSDHWLVSEQDGWEGKVSNSCPHEIS